MGYSIVEPASLSELVFPYVASGRVSFFGNDGGDNTVGKVLPLPGVGFEME